MAGDPVHTGSRTYVLALDVGTSTIRAHVYDHRAIIKGMATRKVVLFQLRLYKALDGNKNKFVRPRPRPWVTGPRLVFVDLRPLLS